MPDPTPSFRPSPGYCMVKPLSKSEVSDTSFALPDTAKDTLDSLGVGRIISLGAVRNKDGEPEYSEPLNIGDVVAYMPFQDVILEEQFTKFSLVAYTSIRAVKEQTNA